MDFDLKQIDRLRELCGLKKTAMSAPPPPMPQPQKPVQPAAPGKPGQPVQQKPVPQQAPAPQKNPAPGFFESLWRIWNGIKEPKEIKEDKKYKDLNPNRPQR